MRPDRQPQRVWSAATAHTITGPVIAIVMGVSGSGKTTVSALLAAALGCQFQEGDDLHPAENVEKMQGGPCSTASLRHCRNPHQTSIRSPWTLVAAQPTSPPR